MPRRGRRCDVMGPWTLFLIASGGICLAMGGLHLAVAIRRPMLWVHFWFGLAALGVAGYCFLTPLSYHAVSVAAYVPVLRWQMAIGSLVTIALAWFIVAFSGLRQRWPAWGATAASLISLASDLVAPYSHVYTHIERLDRVTMPWGEVLALPVGTASVWKFAAEVESLFIAIALVLGCTQLVREGERWRAFFLAVTFGTHLVVAGIYGPLVDLGVFKFPYLGTVAFLLAIVLMGAILVHEVVRGRDLADEIRARDVRWGELLEEIPLLVVIFDTQGRVQWANRFATSTLGYTLDEAVGRSILDFTPRGGHDRAMSAIIRAATTGVPDPAFESLSVTKAGDERRIVWSGVVIRDSKGEIEGLMGIGADVTDQRVTEAQRDRALKDLESLKRELEEENIYLRDEIRSVQGFSGMVGESEPFKKLLHGIRQVAPSDTTVLILGETGVGKELAARAVHDASPRATGPFVAVNCATLPANLVESELFGHERGAFTDARERRKGRFELADGGTLFLDEISELPLELQPKLLRALQQGEFERVGGSVTLHVDVRVIAATNRDLRREVEERQFRQDLYYRLNVYPITVPALRDRREDIHLLVGHFVPTIAAKVGRTIDEVPISVMRQLQEYDWPGNIRELLNVLERSVLTSPGTVLVLPERLHGTGSIPAAEPAEVLRTLEQNEREHLARVLRATDGRIAGPGGAAEILGINPSTLRSRLKKLGLPPRR